MSTAKIFILLFLSENFCCRQSQNVKVIPEYQIKKTKFCRQQKISLKNNKNTSKDNIEFWVVVGGLYFFPLVFARIVASNQKQLKQKVNYLPARL